MVLPRAAGQNHHTNMRCRYADFISFKALVRSSAAAIRESRVEKNRPMRRCSGKVGKMHLSEEKSEKLIALPSLMPKVTVLSDSMKDLLLKYCFQYPLSWLEHSAWVNTVYAGLTIPVLSDSSNPPWNDLRLMTKSPARTSLYEPRLSFLNLMSLLWSSR